MTAVGGFAIGGLSHASTAKLAALEWSLEWSKRDSSGRQRKLGSVLMKQPRGGQRILTGTGVRPAGAGRGKGGRPSAV